MIAYVVIEQFMVKAKLLYNDCTSTQSNNIYDWSTKISNYQSINKRTNHAKQVINHQDQIDHQYQNNKCDNDRAYQRDTT